MKNKSSFALCCLLLALLISVGKINAQENNIFEINDSNSLSKSTNKKDNDRDEFYKLAFNMHTTAYLKDNTIKTIYGDGAIKKVTIQDLNSFNILTSNTSKFKDVVLINIFIKSLNELNNHKDISNLTELQKLKYVFIRCSFECNKEDIQNFIKTNPNVRVFYNADKPS